MIQRLRVSVLILVHVLILLHIYYFKDGVIGSIDFQEFFHSFLKLGVINSGVILVIFSFFITLLFGRFFCGWACHFGAIQELSWYILKKLKIKTITIDSKLVVILPAIILLNYYIIPNIWHMANNPWGEISISLNSPSIWEFLPGFVIGILTFFIDGFLIVYFLGKKGFCRFICPWGAFLKLPNMFAPFKVRKTGNCTLCHECTTGCPVGIDVSYEINNFGKVNNTNCTSCLICTSSCPSNALSYSFKNPLKENFNIKDFFKGKLFYLHDNIKNQFLSIRSKDITILIFTIIFSLTIDGLYGIGHFMAYGIGIICSFIIFGRGRFNFSKIIFSSILCSIFLWHGVIKLSIWKGIQDYESNNYYSSINHLERAVNLYPKSIGKFHIMLGQMYYNQGDIKKSIEHAKIATAINPNYKSTNQLYDLINSLQLDQ